MKQEPNITYYWRGIQKPLDECIKLLNHTKNNPSELLSDSWEQDCINFFTIWLYNIKEENVYEEIDGITYLKEELKTKVAWEGSDLILYNNPFQKCKELNGKGHLEHTSKENELALIEWIETY